MFASPTALLAAPTVEQVKEAYDALSPENQRTIDAEVQRILDERLPTDDAS